MSWIKHGVDVSTIECVEGLSTTGHRVRVDAFERQRDLQTCDAFLEHLTSSSHVNFVRDVWSRSK
jgi:hypothetical protein